MWNLAPMQCVDLALLKQVNCLIVNEVELNQLHSEFHQTLGPNNGSAKDVEQKAWDIFTLTRQSVVVTLGAKGTLAVHNNTLLTVPALAISPVDTVGAGDAFTGAFTAALDRGETFPVALRWGVAGGLASEPARNPLCPLRHKFLSILLPPRCLSADEDLPAEA